MIGDRPTKPRVYLETTIPSYLTSRRSRDLLVAAHQQLTSDWWQDHRHRFHLFTSQRVLIEAGSGDALAARRRLDALDGIALLQSRDDALQLARHFMRVARFPENSSKDALHVAIAAVHGMNFLMTWNCRDIANAEIVRRLAAVCGEAGWELPILCTPEQLMGAETMFDPIVEEIRKIREEHAARFNYDLDAIFEDWKKSEKASGLPVVNLPPNRPPGWTAPEESGGKAA